MPHMIPNVKRAAHSPPHTHEKDEKIAQKKKYSKSPISVCNGKVLNHLANGSAHTATKTDPKPHGHGVSDRPRAANVCM